jgi:branched-chain amino acid transport system permease protein
MERRTLSASVATALVLVAIIVVIAIVAADAPGSRQRIVTAGMIHVIVVTGMYIFIGNSGIVSFGHIGFMGLGAYTAAWLTIPPATKASLMPGLPEVIAMAEISPWLAAVAGGLLAAAVALAFGIPLMRLSGITASIGTFAILAILQAIFANWTEVTGGQGSLYGLPVFTNVGIAATWAAITILAAAVYQATGAGMRLRASREDAEAAAAVGVHVHRERLIAFVLSAFFVGIAGALYAHFLMTVVAGEFYLKLTFITIAMLVIGGMRSLTGAFCGVVFVLVLAELLRQAERGVDLGLFSFSGRPGLQEVGLAVAMLLALVFRPSGLTGGRELNVLPRKWMAFPRISKRRSV